MGVSFGGVVLTPLATWMIDVAGWREAWFWLGIGATVFTLPLALIMRRAPEDTDFTRTVIQPSKSNKEWVSERV